MIPAPFSYVRPATADEAVAALTDHGDEAKLLAGGHSLLPLMKLRLAQPEVLVDIGRLRDLSYVRDEGDHVAVGALTRHRDLERSSLLGTHLPLLAHAAGTVGDVQVRHRGTIGGSLCHADPASDLPAVVAALDATLVAQGPDGRREIPARSFFEDFWETSLAPGELLVEIRLPKTTGLPWSFQKFNRRAADWAIVGVAAQRLATGRTAVALVNMDAVPFRAAATEEALAADASPADAAALAAEGTSPVEDLSATKPYRRHLARVLTRRALEAL